MLSLSVIPSPGLRRSCCHPVQVPAESAVPVASGDLWRPDWNHFGLLWTGKGRARFTLGGSPTRSTKVCQGSRPSPKVVMRPLRAVYARAGPACQRASRGYGGALALPRGDLKNVFRALTYPLCLTKNTVCDIASQ
jgi:hypothetical protein